MRKIFASVAVFLLAAVSFGADSPWAFRRFAPDAIKEYNLASATDWSLSIDDGAPRPIKVTAGGWNSDQQNPQIASADVKDHVVYERRFSIPAEAKDGVVKIMFGGCNYGAEVFLGSPEGKKVVEHNVPMTPFEADLTGLVETGKTYVLRVKAYTRYHYGKTPEVPVGFDFNKGMTKQYEGHTKFAYGLIGYVRLAIYPSVCISDVCVRPSLEKQVLVYDVWARNATKAGKKLLLKGQLLEKMSPAAKRRKYSYPTVEDKELDIPAGQTVKVTVEVPWDFGPASYWWPNIPFSETYFANLHYIKLALVEGGNYIHERQQRFGFVEYKEGPFYYTVNGVRFNSFGDSSSYGQIGEYDCWTETACFQPPVTGQVAVAGAAAQGLGCIETWKNYQRVGFNTMRLSTSVPTEYMMETADEAGFMLIPEGGSWGNGTCKFDKDNFSRQVQETILACRNHPCVARYSLANESISGSGGDWRWLIDAALEVDATRPYVFEVNPKKGDGAVKGMKNGHAYRMQHYDPIEKGGDHIRGMGECAWTTDGMADFAMQAVKMRMNDYAHFAPWSWLNYWPNFLEGMNAEKHPWKTNDYGDRKDSVDGWYSPMIGVVQHALDGYLLVDVGILKKNPVIKENSKSVKIDWPYEVPEYSAGSKIERKIEVFNGGLRGEDMELRWTARWDNAEGPEAAKGTVGPFKIEPGFHATQVLEFEAPKPDGKEKDLYLVLESVKDDSVVGQESRIHFKVTGK